MAEEIKPTTVPKVDASGQTAAELAEQAGLGLEDEGAVLENLGEGQNPDAAVGSVLEEQPDEVEPPLVSTSDEARADTEQTGQQIDTAASAEAEPVGIAAQSQAAFDAGFDILTDAADRIKTDREQSITNIEEAARIRRADVETEQRLEKGLAGKKLARIGGFLGGSGSGIAYMNSLGESHRLEISKLELAKAQVIEKAKIAFDNRETTLAKTLMDEANVFQNQINEQRTLAMDEAKFAVELNGLERADDSLTFEALIAGGHDLDTIPDSYFASLDTQRGRTPGTSKGLFEITQDEYNDTKTIDDITKAKTLSDYLATRPFGEPTTIGDDTYYGTDRGQIEIDKDGMGTSIYIDETGSVVSRNLGFVGKPQDKFQLIKDAEGNPWSYDSITGQLFSVFGSQASWDIIAPEGSVWDNFGQRTVNLGECGALINDIYTDIQVGDTYEDKLKIVDESITSDTVKEGDIVVSSAGTTGHVASVEEVKFVNGKKMLRLFESNYNGDKKITHNRWVEADDQSLKFGTGTLRSEFISGTDGQGWVTKAEIEARTAVSQETIDDWARKKINSGDDKMSDVPLEMRPEVVAAEARLLREGYTVPIDFVKVQGKARTARGEITNVDELLPLINENTVGSLRNIAEAKLTRGTPEFDVAQKLEQLKVRLGFDELQYMRDNSPTGGSLGQISEREGEWLQNAMVSLNQGLTPEQLTKNLEEVKMHYQMYILSKYSINPDLISSDKYKKIIDEIKLTNNQEDYKALKAKYEKGEEDGPTVTDNSFIFGDKTFDLKL